MLMKLSCSKKPHDLVRFIDFDIFVNPSQCSTNNLEKNIYHNIMWPKYSFIHGTHDAFAGPTRFFLVWCVFCVAGPLNWTYVWNIVFIAFGILHNSIFKWNKYAPFESSWWFIISVNEKETRKYFRIISIKISVEQNLNFFFQFSLFVFLSIKPEQITYVYEIKRL